MKAEKIFTVRTISGYVALCDDGEYHRLTPSMRIMTGALVHDYVPRRLGRGAEDITDTPEGRVLLGTANAYEARTDRAQTAAAARWGLRGESASIRVDKDVAAALAEVPERSRRELASSCIRRALSSKDGNAYTAFEFSWNMFGEDVARAVETRKVVFCPHKGVETDYTPMQAAKILVQNEIDSLSHKLKLAVDFDPGVNPMENIPDNWNESLDTSRMLLGLDEDCMTALSIAAYIDFISWARRDKTK